MKIASFQFWFLEENAQKFRKCNATVNVTESVFIKYISCHGDTVYQVSSSLVYTSILRFTA